ncbi:hypothetical protein FACS1894170_06170 [Planctomycetales bacterium]|nr:hypothetical protein FACS1894170_06170 [Planctomycetales bacterium]
MVLPSKHIKMSESLLGLGSFILESLQRAPHTFDDIWEEFSLAQKNKTYPFPHNLENFNLALLLLYSMNLITEEKGVIRLCA